MLVPRQALFREFAVMCNSVITLPCDHFHIFAEEQNKGADKLLGKCPLTESRLLRHMIKVNKTLSDNSEIGRGSVDVHLTPADTLNTESLCSRDYADKASMATLREHAPEGKD